MAYMNPHAGQSYHCVKCREKKLGRFTNVYRVGSGWTQGRHHVSWYCWDCAPFGQGLRPAETQEPQERTA